MILIIKTKKSFINKLIVPFYIIMVLSLVGLLFFGTSINNSKCWYSIPGIISFEPCEFMKISLILILAKVITNFNRKKTSFKNEIIFISKVLGLVLIPVILTFLQPDTGAIIIYLVITFIMMFTSKLRTRWFIVFGIILLLILGVSTFIYFYDEELFINIFSSDIYYRLNRLKDFKDGTSFQLENALIGIGSAGLLGHFSMPLYFPEAATDFIFAVFASSLGFIGSVILIILFILFDIKIILDGKEDTIFGKYLIIGFIAMISFQQIQNIGMNIGLLPIMGITLPFISYGGSSLLSYFVMLGLIYNTKKA